jgi:pimeloyl-ACP methyl ester carboxylesterase
MSNTITPTVFYRTLNLEGLEIFYREAGPRDAPTVLLLHGFPSSSHMFRNLIPLLADKYHVVAPDFPGYGESSAPSVNDFDYSFERLATVTEKFICAIPLRHRFIGWLPVSCHASRTSDRYDRPKRGRPC